MIGGGPVWGTSPVKRANMWRDEALYCSTALRYSVIPDTVTRFTTLAIVCTRGVVV